MRKSRTKRKSKSFLFGIIVLIVLVAIVGCNIALGFLKDTVRTVTAAYFPQRLAVDNILYVPPNYIFLKNISLTETAVKPEKQVISIPLLLVKFSVLRFIEKGKFVLTDICVYNASSDYPVFRDFLRDNYKRIWDFIMDLPRQDIRFMVKDSRLAFGPELGGPGYINAHFFLKIKSDAFFSYGSLSRNLQQKPPGLPVDYTLRGSLAQDGVTLDNIEIMRENLYAKLWGSVHAAVLRLNGFSFVNTRFSEHQYFEPYLTLKERTENFLRGFPAPPRMADMPKIDLFFLDLETQIAFKFPRVDIETLKFSLNNNPMSLKGNIVFSWKDPVMLDLVFATRFTRLQGRADENLNLKKLEVALNGALKDKAFTGNATVNFDFLKKKAGSTPLEAFNAKLDNMNFSFAQFPRMSLSLREADIYCRTDSNEYTMQLPYVSANLDLKKPTVKFCQFYSGFYDGSLSGRAWLDMSLPSPQLQALVRVKNATANKMEKLVVHLSKVHGKLSGLMKFKTSPNFSLKGGTVIKHGYIENFEFLKWLSGSFALPSLRRIYFPQATTYFSIDPDGAGLQDIHLASQDLSLAGAFHLGTNNMVNSTISLTFTRLLMQRSPKFRPLLRLVGKDVSVLTFDFKLSGSLHGMNFQWLESDFKRRLREAIPGFMERSVERKIEESLAPLSSGNP